MVKRDFSTLLVTKVMIRKLSGYVKSFDGTKYKIWNNNSDSINNGFDSKPIFSENQYKFHDNGIPEEGYHYLSISNINNSDFI